MRSHPSGLVIALVSVVVVLAALSTGAGKTPTGLQITGRALRFEGAPAAGATAQLYPFGSPFDRARFLMGGTSVEPVARSAIDDDGWFRIAAPHAGLWTVRVAGAGFVAMEFQLLPLTENIQLPQVELPVDRGMSLRVRNSDDLPIGGATVRLERPAAAQPGAALYPMWRAAPREGTTGEDGTLVLPCEGEERITLTAAASGYRLRTRESLRGPSAGVTLERGTARTIEVRQAGDEPAAGVLIVAGSSLHPLGLTDERGRARLTLATGQERELRVLSVDGRTIDPRREIPDGEDPSALRLILPPAAAVDGRVIDRLTREPLSGAIVWPQNEPWNGVVAGRDGRFSLLRPGDGPSELTAGYTGYLRSPPLRARPAGPGGRPSIIALQPAAAVEGTVADGEGAPVAGAQVTLGVMRIGRDRYYFPNPWEALPVARSGPQGRFRLAPLDPAHDYFVTARSERFAPAAVEIVGLEPRTTRTDVRLVLTSGQMVTGRVLDAADEPLAGAAITLVPSPSQTTARFGRWRMLEQGAPIEGTSGAEGRFVVRGVPAGPHDVAIRHPGFATLQSARHEVAESVGPNDLGTFRLLPGATLRGRIVGRGGLPLAGAEIHVDGGGPVVLSDPDGFFRREPDATSGADGWFAIEDLRPGGMVDLRVSHDGYVRLTAPGVSLPQVEPLILTMQAASRVTGLVVDADDDPIAGAEVTVLRRREGGSGSSMYWYTETRSAQTGGDGLFLIEDVGPGRVTLTASAPGYREARLEGLDVPPGEPLADLRITLHDGAILIGRVTAADQRPCAGARVMPIAAQNDRMPQSGPPLLTDGEGNYRLEGLAPGPLSIEANLEGHTRAVKEIDLHPGINELDLVLGEGQTVSGLVTDPSGAPIANALVGLRAPGERWSAVVETEQDGNFVIEGVEDGEFVPWAKADRFAPYEHGATVHVAGEPLSGLSIRMQPAASIAGRVIGVDPIDYPLLRLSASGPGAWWYDDIGVDHEGGYRVENLSAGEYRVTASIEGRGTQAGGSVLIEEGVGEARLDLEFGAGLTLAGRALAGTNPIAGALIFVRHEEGRQTGWGRTDHDGRFRIEGLDPSTYNLQLRQFETGLVHSEEVLLGTSRDIEIRVPVARLGGRVADAATSQPLEGVRAELKPATTGGSGSADVFLTRSTTTDSTGRFSIDNLSGGAWRVSFSRAGYAEHGIEVQLAGGAHRDDLAIELSPTEGLALTVRLADGRYPHSVRIAALDGEGTVVASGSFTTGENGLVRLSSLPPGSWDLILETGGAATTMIRVTAPGAPLSVTLGEPTGLEVSIPGLAPGDPPATLTIVDPSGRPYRSLDWDGTPRSRWTIGRNGSEFQTLPAGTWTIRAQIAGGTILESSATTAPGSIVRVELN